MKKVFITGADGYIGSRLAQELSDKYRIIRILQYGENARLLLDLEKPEKFQFDQIEEGSYVIHLAAVSSPDKCAKEYDRSRQINVTGTSYFIGECLKRGSRVLFFSSDVVYGASDFEGEKYFDENSSCNPLGEYGYMKREVEKSFIGKGGFKVFRLSYVYSKNDKFILYLRSCCEKEKVADIFHPFFRNVVYIEDIIAAVKKLIDKWESTKESVFNIVGPETISRKKMAELYKREADPRLQVKITKPEESFFKNRPKTIRVRSLYLNKLLERPPTELGRAYCLEKDESLLNNKN
jgi:dTDP-4-dehydrorhamnose reductase